MITMKFGGSCLASGEDLARVVRTATRDGLPVVAVLSALHGVTDALVGACEAARAGRVDLQGLAELHYRAVAGLGAPEASAARAALDGLLEGLEKVLLGVKYLGECSPATRDRILAHGERLAVVCAAGHARALGVPTREVLDDRSGIVTDGTSGNAQILEGCREAVREALSSEALHLVAGFIGRDRDGQVTTLGRGGSDYSASFIAAALGTGLVLWKDVDGFRTADPRVVPGARVIERMHYLDALELCHYGSKVIHAKAIVPAMRARVTMEVRGFREGATGSTRIDDQASQVLAIAHLRGVTAIDLHGYSTDILRALASLFERLALAGIHPLLLTEASPMGETSIVLPGDAADGLRGALRDLEGAFEVEYREGLSVVSIVGSGMSHVIGFAAQVFRCLADQGINIVAIAQTASERNVSVMVADERAEDAARALHEAFVRP